MFENIILPVGFHKVETTELEKTLSTIGTRSANYFFKDDIIEFSDIVVIDDAFVPRSERNNPNAQKRIVAYIYAAVNGVEKRLPLGSFNRFPRDVDAFLEKHPIARSLYQGSHYDRYLFLKGKKLKVTAVEEWEAVDWSKSDLSTNHFEYKSSKYPIFEVI